MTPFSRSIREEAEQQFRRLVERGLRYEDLAEAALLIEVEEQPESSPPDERYGARGTSVADRVGHGLSELEMVAAGARRRLEAAGAGGGRAAVEALNENLFDFEGFAGDAENYYDLRNSLLTRVIERRRGIPITLSIVYIHVARRAGLAAEGVGLPGHFVVRAEEVLVDPFANRIIDEDDCQARLDELYGGQVPLTDEHLRAVSPRETLARVSQNIKNIYVGAGLDRDALRVLDRIELLDPGYAHLRRDRGMLLARLDRYAEAAEELRQHLAGAEDEEAAETLKRVQARAANLN